MPWCEECSKFWNPTTMPEGGTCPSCGTVIAAPARTARSVPWHFKLLLIGLVIYLIYRVYWLAVWIPKHV